MGKANDPWNGWKRDNTKSHRHDKLKARLASDPTLLGRLIGQLKHYIDPEVGSYDAMMVDEEATWNANIQRGHPDRLSRQAQALWCLCHAGATHPAWWRQHWPDDKPAVAYANGQANYLRDCVGLLFADGVRLPRHLRALYDGMPFSPPVTITAPNCICNRCKAPIRHTHDAPAWTRFKGRRTTRAQRRTAL